MKNLPPETLPKNLETATEKGFAEIELSAKELNDLFNDHVERVRSAINEIDRKTVQAYAHAPLIVVHNYSNVYKVHNLYNSNVYN